MTHTRIQKLALTLALSAAALGSQGSLAQAQTATPPAPSSAVKAPKTPVSSAVKYYDADPLNGGKLIGSATVPPTRGQDRFAGAPTGAKFAVLESPRGTEIVDLSAVGRGGIKGQQAPVENTAMGPRGRGGQDARGSGKDQGKDARGPQNRGQGGPQGRGEGMGMRAGGKVSFYSGNPLSGGKLLSSFDGSSAQTSAQMDAAAKSAKFAVIERGGVRHIVDLSQNPWGQNSRSSRK